MTVFRLSIFHHLFFSFLYLYLSYLLNLLPSLFPTFYIFQILFLSLIFFSGFLFCLYLPLFYIPFFLFSRLPYMLYFPSMNPFRCLLPRLFSLLSAFSFSLFLCLQNVSLSSTHPVLLYPPSPLCLSMSPSSTSVYLALSFSSLRNLLHFFCPLLFRLTSFPFHCLIFPTFSFFCLILNFPLILFLSFFSTFFSFFQTLPLTQLPPFLLFLSFSPYLFLSSILIPPSPSSSLLLPAPSPPNFPPKGIYIPDLSQVFCQNVILARPSVCEDFPWSRMYLPASSCTPGTRPSLAGRPL